MAIHRIIRPLHAHLSHGNQLDENNFNDFVCSKLHIYIYIYIYIYISRKRTQRIFFNTRDWKTFCFSRLLLVLEKFVSRHMNGRECSEVQQEGSPQTGGTRFWGKLPRCFCLGGESTCTTEFDVPGGITPLDKDQRKVRQLMSEMS